MQFIDDKQRHINDVQAVDSPHQRTDDKQRVGQRRSDNPCQRHLSAQNRTKHDRLAARFVRMLAGEGKHLRVGGGAEAAEKYPDEQQNKVVTVPGEEHAGQHAHQAAEDDQPLAVAFAIRTPGEELAHQNADHRATGKKEADHRRPYVNLVRQKQAQRWRLECPGDTRQEGDDQKGGRGEIKPASWQGGATVLHVGVHRFSGVAEFTPSLRK